MSPRAMPATPKCRSITTDQWHPRALSDPGIDQNNHTYHGKRTWISSNPYLPRKNIAVLRPTNGTQAYYHSQPCVRSRTPAKRIWMASKAMPSMQKCRGITRLDEMYVRRHSQSCVRNIKPATQKRTYITPRPTPATQQCCNVAVNQGDPSASLDPAMCQK